MGVGFVSQGQLVVGAVQEVALCQELVACLVQWSLGGWELDCDEGFRSLICLVRRVKVPLFKEKLAFISLMDISSSKAGAMVPSSCSWAARACCCAASGIVVVVCMEVAFRGFAHGIRRSNWAWGRGPSIKWVQCPNPEVPTIPRHAR